jgi:TolB-like protein
MGQLNRTLNDRVRAMLIDADADLHLWAKRMINANYVRFICLVAGIAKTPLELLNGMVPDVTHLRVFDAETF